MPVDRPCAAAAAVVDLLLAVVVVPVLSVPLQLVPVAVVDDEAVAEAVVDMSRSDDAAYDALVGFHDRRDQATRLLLQRNSSRARSDRVVVPLSCALYQALSVDDEMA
jgi:hypothetical protein